MSRRIVMHPAEQKRQARKRLMKVAHKLSWALDQIIAALDEIDGEPDLEPDLGSVTTAPWSDQKYWAQGVNDNSELDECDFEDGGDLEPSLGSLENLYRGFIDYGGLKQPYGEHCQLYWAEGSTSDYEVEHDGREPEDVESGSWTVAAFQMNQTYWKG